MQGLPVGQQVHGERGVRRLERTLYPRGEPGFACVQRVDIAVDSSGEVR